MTVVYGARGFYLASGREKIIAGPFATEREALQRLAAGGFLR